MQHIRVSIVAGASGATSLIGAITARQEQFDFWFRQCGTAVAILAGGFSILYVIHNWNKKL